jgi:hypothetical protein
MLYLNVIIILPIYAQLNYSKEIGISMITLAIVSVEIAGIIVGGVRMER